MESLNNLNEIELNNLFDNLYNKHEKKKEEIIVLTYKLDEIMKLIEKKELELTEIEEKYTNLIKFIYSKKNVQPEASNKEQ